MQPIAHIGTGLEAREYVVALDNSYMSNVWVSLKVQKTVWELDLSWAGSFPRYSI